MDKLVQHLRQLNDKVSQLEQLIRKLQVKNDELTQEVNNLRQSLSEQEKAYDKLMEKYEAAKMIKGLNQQLNHEGLNDKIDQYLKEIDICLKYFGVQE